MSMGRADESTLPRRKILVVGDSQVKFMDRLFCSRNRRNRTWVCFSDAGVRDVGDRLTTVMKGERWL